MADGTNVTDAMLLEAAAGRENDWIKQAGESKNLPSVALSALCSKRLTCRARTLKRGGGANTIESATPTRWQLS